MPPRTLKDPIDFNRLESADFFNTTEFIPIYDMMRL